jgi:hypothetical protein
MGNNFPGSCKEKSIFFECIIKRFPKDREIVMLAVRENGNLLEYADPSFKKDKEIVYEACKGLNSNKALLFAPDLNKNKEFVTSVLKDFSKFAVGDLGNGYQIMHADESIQKDIDTVMIALKYFGGSDAFSFEKEYLHPSVRENSLVISYLDQNNFFQRPEENEKENIDKESYVNSLTTPPLKLSDRIILMKFFKITIERNVEDFSEEEMNEMEELSENTEKIKVEREQFDDLCTTNDRDIIIKVSKYWDYLVFDQVFGSIEQEFDEQGKIYNGIDFNKLFSKINENSSDDN